jgi:hypothetical protein
MTVIREADVIASVADALQYISYYHTPDFIRAMGRAYDMEQSPAARDAIAQMLTNSRMCAEGHRPICQDTGIVVVFVKVGMGVRWDATRDLPAMINEGVRRAYLNPENKLRASIVSDPAFKRSNTRDNTPAVIHTEFVPGEQVDITVAAKGGGSENKSRFAMLNPSDSVADWVLEMVPEMGGRLVSARNAGGGYRRQRREGHAAGQGVVDGVHRHRRSDRARTEIQIGRTSLGNIPAGQRPWARCARPRGPNHRVAARYPLVGHSGVAAATRGHDTNFRRDNMAIGSLALLHGPHYSTRLVENRVDSA